jgi:hypothetical protein
VMAGASALVTLVLERGVRGGAAKPATAGSGG